MSEGGERAWKIIDSVSAVGTYLWVLVDGGRGVLICVEDPLGHKWW
jgi:hypothetical protein